LRLSSWETGWNLSFEMANENELPHLVLGEANCVSATRCDYAFEPRSIWLGRSARGSVRWSDQLCIRNDDGTIVQTASLGRPEEGAVQGTCTTWIYTLIQTDLRDQIGGGMYALVGVYRQQEAWPRLTRVDLDTLQTTVGNCCFHDQVSSSDCRWSISWQGIKTSRLVRQRWNPDAAEVVATTTCCFDVKWGVQIVVKHVSLDGTGWFWKQSRKKTQVWVWPPNDPPFCTDIPVPSRSFLGRWSSFGFIEVIKEPGTGKRLACWTRYSKLDFYSTSYQEFELATETQSLMHRCLGSLARRAESQLLGSGLPEDLVDLFRGFCAYFARTSPNNKDSASCAW
jgi:hypothetical protein